LKKAAILILPQRARSNEDTEENCRGLIYQALSLKKLPVGFDESNPYDRIHLTRVGYFVIFAAWKNKIRIAVKNETGR